MVIAIFVVITSSSDNRNHGATRRIEEHLARAFVLPAVEVEHVVKRSGDGVERAARLNALAVKPIVFNESERRRLISQGVIDEVPFCERRNYQQRRAGSVTATSVYRLAEIAIQGRGAKRPSLLEAVAVIADAGTVEGVDRRVERRVHDWRHLMIVPSVRVVIHDEDGSFRPFRADLQGIDDANDETLP